MIREAAAWFHERLHRPRPDHGTADALRRRLQLVGLGHITPGQFLSWEADLEPGEYLSADLGGNLYVMHNGEAIYRFIPPD